MDTTIRKLDETAYRRLKARAALEGRTIGETVNEAIRAYLDPHPPPGEGDAHVHERQPEYPRQEEGPSRDARGGEPVDGVAHGEDVETPVDRLGRALGELPEVRLAYLFGSRARERSRPDSDFDVAVRVDEGYAGERRGETIRRLAARLGREVSSAHLDIVLLNDAPPLLRHRVLRDGRLLFERDARERVRFATRTIRDHQDWNVRREFFLKRRIERLQNGYEDGGSGELLEKARSAARLFAQDQGVP